MPVSLNLRDKLAEFSLAVSDRRANVLPRLWPAEPFFDGPSDATPEACSKSPRIQTAPNPLNLALRVAHRRLRARLKTNRLDWEAGNQGAACFAEEPRPVSPRRLLLSAVAAKPRL